jgi:hypothetical protein
LGTGLASSADRSIGAGLVRLGGIATLSGAIAFVLITALAFANGGYGAVSWGWAALVLLWVGALVVALSAEVRFGALELTSLVGLAGLLAWTLLSNLWTWSATRTVLEGERTVVYLVALCVLLVVGRRAGYRMILAGVWAATALVCTYSLVTRLFPRRFGVIDPIAGYRLSEPIGYWNSLGLFAAMGALLAVGFAARGRQTAFRALAAASLVVLLPTIYFTFSRGAWIAAGIGLAATIAIDSRRLRLLTTSILLVPATGLAVLLAYRSPALSRVHPSLSDAAAAGHRLAVWIVVLAVVNALVVIGLRAVERRAHVSALAKRAFAAALALVVVAALASAFVRFGGPVTIARHGWDAFAAPPPTVASGSLNSRLFNLSGTGRLPQWRVAIREFEQHPWLGSGAGTYELFWDHNRPFVGQIRDAHNLYIETLGELGFVGLALLVVALAPPLLAAVRARNRALVAPACGAYVAYLAHAIVDWDWELPAVTLAALACGAAVLVAARREVPGFALSPRLRLAAAVAALPLLLFVVIALVGNAATASATNAANDGNWSRAASQARSARRWAPWSATPWQLRAEAQLAGGNVPAARASFRTAVAKDPHDWTLWFGLAQVSHGAAARRALATARRLNPRSPEIAQYAAANASTLGR